MVSAEHPFYQRWANRSLPIVALDRALENEHFISVVGDDFEDAKMLASELRQFPAESVVYLGALPRILLYCVTAALSRPRKMHNTF